MWFGVENKMFLRLKGLIYNFCLPLPERKRSLGFINVSIYHLRHCPSFLQSVQERKSQAGSCAMTVSTGYTRNNTAKTVCMYLCKAGRFVSIYTAPHLSLLLFSAIVCLLSLNSSVHRVHFGHWDIDRGALRFEDNTELYTFF